MNDSLIVVIIAAYNAEATIARSVRSALDTKHVSQVIVIDDASTDATSKTARDASGGDPRLKVLLQTANQGPAAARNRAIRESSAPIIAILDADDYFIKGRFDPLLEHQDWDLCADNLVFFSDESQIDTLKASAANNAPPRQSFSLDLEQFVIGNISQRKRVRGELGFLKPLIRRSFLEKNNLTYDENCRLGEDFILYTRSLAIGARFKVVNSCGYAALVRNNSLSGSHSVVDLAALHSGSIDLQRALPLSSSERKSLMAHSRSIMRKIIYREVLEVRQRKGLLKGIWAAFLNPTSIADILNDRISPPKPQAKLPRMLLSAEDMAERCQ